MNKTLSNRIRQAETAAAFKENRKRGPSGMGAVYELINNPGQIRTPQFKRLLSEMSDSELLEQCGHHADGFSLDNVPTHILRQASNSKHPDRVLADWHGGQP